MRHRFQTPLLLALLAPAGPALVAVAAQEPAPATPAYRAAFGQAPSTEAPEQCLAAVVFLPGAGASGRADRLSALPLFLLDPERVLEHTATVLVEGHGAPQRFFEPPRAFPPGSRLLGVERDGGAAVLRVALEAGAVPGPLAAQAAAHTLAQFPGIGAVRIAVEGGDPDAEVRPDPALLEQPGPPRLLDVAAPYHEGETPRDVHVLFDRPVEVISLRLRHADGTALPGQLYQHAFAMSVVLRPAPPASLREGLPLVLSWSVVDFLGRQSQGERAVDLRLHEEHR